MNIQTISTRLSDVYHMARLCHQTSAVIHSRALEAIAPLAGRTPAGRRRYTQWLAGYAAGMIATHNAALWREVEFCYRDQAGIIYSTHKQSAHRSTEEFYTAGRGHELGAMECAHVWRGTDKPFTPWGK